MRHHAKAPKINVRILSRCITPDLPCGACPADATWHGCMVSVVADQGRNPSGSQRFASDQERAACLISGAYRTTAAEGLNTKPKLPSVHLQVEPKYNITCVTTTDGAVVRGTIPPSVIIRD
ncbi:zinc knuckle domain protein [Penicillium atrosanguineum]|nr:zinc knuckle domain protein [Penicillium atrosanguineum]